MNTEDIMILAHLGLSAEMKLYRAGYLMHLGKVAYEKYWLFKWF